MLKALCTVIAAAFAAGVYWWGNVIDHQNGGETWVFRVGIAIAAIAAGAYLIWLEEE